MENKVSEKVQDKDAPVICVVCYKFYGNAKQENMCSGCWKKVKQDENKEKQ